MHPLLALPYAVVGALGSAAARLPLPGESKLVRSLRARRDALAHFERWGAAARDPARTLLWMHAPSVGEGLQARPVLAALRARHPDWQVAYTFFSPSAERFATTVGADVTGYLPFDTAAAADRMLDALRPSAIVVAKLDLWPTLAERAHRRGVPLGMVAATLSAGSGRRGALARALLGDAYAALSAVGAIDAADAERLAALGVPPDLVTVTGDTRYDQVFARAVAVDHEGPLLRRLAGARPTLVAGSTWPADEARLLRAWRAVRGEVPDARLIIAPHEPTAAHLAPIRRWAAGEGLRFATLGEAAPTDDVVLVDRVGVLGDLYALADAAYVGGGFHAAGLHSVLEPAAFGVPVVFGPRHANSRDAGLLVECAGGFAAGNEAELARAVRIVLTEADSRERAGAAARALVEGGLGASERSAALIERMVLRQMWDGGWDKWGTAP